MDEITMNAFPSNEIEALAMLYVQSQDLSKASPKDLLDLYNNAHNQIFEYAQEIQRSKEEWF